MTLAVTPEEVHCLSSFLQDQERARRRVADLEEQAHKLVTKGKIIPAAAHLRTARLLRRMWCLDEAETLCRVQWSTTYIMGNSRHELQTPTR